MRKASIVGLVVCSFVLSCFAQQPLSVDTPYGQFQATISVSEERYGSGTIVGDITNNTSKDWIELEFRLTYFDAYGGELLTSGGVFNKIYVGSLKKGEAFSLGRGEGSVFILERTGGTPDARPRVAKFGIRLAGGTIPADYSFALLKKTPAPAAAKPPARAGVGKTTSVRAAAKTAPPEQIIESSDLKVNDSDMEIGFAISKTEFGFVLRNTSEEPIEIDWNQLAYVDASGESHKVIHNGVKFIDRDKPLVSTTIPPSARIEDIVMPVDYVYFVEGEYGGWRHRPFFPDGEKASLYKGQVITLFMPLKVNGKVKNYTFKFKIVDVQV